MPDTPTIDDMIARQAKRLAERPDPVPASCQHVWGTAYQSASGRKVCVKCGLVTDKPFETLGVGER